MDGLSKTKLEGTANETSKLQDALKRALAEQEVINSCNQSVSTFASTMRELSKNQPRALEKFFDVKLLRTPTGEIEKVDGDEVKGYATLWGFNQTYDTGLRGKILDWELRNKSYCNQPGKR